MADDRNGQELWELAVDVPPVVESVHNLRVACGHTELIVEQGRNGWAGHNGYRRTEPRRHFDQAVADARRWVEQQERRRLLTNALDVVVGVAVEPDESYVSDGDGGTDG